MVYLLCNRLNVMKRLFTSTVMRFTFLFLLSILIASNGFSQSNVKPTAILTPSDSVAKDQVSEETSKEIIKPKIKNKLTKREYKFSIGRSTFKGKYGARIQTRFDSWQYQNSDKKNGNKLFFRRIRFKSDGQLFTPKLGYKIEVDLLNPNLLDAVIKWNFYGNFTLKAGQTKLRGNRERVISSQNLQLVDRSLLNSKFTLDRDIGVWLSHKADLNQIVFKTILSVSKGEGRYILIDDNEPINSGLDYTARFEILPFGSFKKKGDYKGGDLEREERPKFAFGVSYDYNDNAARSRGQKGEFVPNNADLSTWIVDFMFKYNGFSWMTEYANRQIGSIFNGNIETQPSNIDSFYLGNAFNTQAGYMFGNNFEVAARYTQVSPLFDNNNLKEYTVGLSKYIVGHKIKVQTDYSILKESPNITRSLYRLQFELSL